MTARHRVRSAVVGFVVLVLTGSAVPVSAGVTSSAPSPEAVVVDVPLGPRAEPRRVEVLATDGTDALVLYADAGVNSGRLRLLREDGTWSDLETRPNLLAGGFLVTYGGTGGAPTSAQPVSGGPPVVLATDGYDVVGAAADGLLRREGGYGSFGVSVQPWDGSPPQTVEGLPDGVTQVLAYGAPGGPGAFLDIQATVAQGTGRYWVDTAARRAWQVPAGRDPVASGSTLAWWQVDGAGTVAVETVPRPLAGQPLAAVTRQQTDLVLPYWDRARVELAGEVPLVVTSEYREPGYHAYTTSRIVDGSLQPLVEGAGRGRADGSYLAVVHDPDPAVGGRIVAVDTGDGTASTVTAFEPVPAAASEVSVGNGRVYVGGDGVDAMTSYALEESTLGPRTSFPAESGARFSAGGGAVLVAAPSARVHAPDGTLVSASGADLGAPVVSHGSRALARPYGLGETRSWPDGALLAPEWLWVEDVSGGMLVGYNYDSYWSAQGSYRRVSVVDPDSGRADAVDLSARCSWTDPSIQAVGTWLLVGCDDEPSVVDRTSYAPATVLPRSQGEESRLTLGDGFVVRMLRDEGSYAPTAALEWLDPRDPDGAWQPLGRVRSDYFDGREHDRLSVSRDGTTPAVAWLDADGGAKVAFLPVEPLPPMPLPTGPTVAPGAVSPSLSSPPGSKRIDVSWTSRPATEQVVEHEVRLAAAPQPDVTLKTLRLPGSATSATFTGLSPWASYRVTVTTRNAIGSTTSPSVEAEVVPSDTVAPYYAVATVPAVSLASTNTLRPTAADTTSPVVAIDVRVRQAATGKALGGWTYPTAWQRLDNLNGGQPVPLSGLARGYTYCYSVRARDYFDNVSAWSPQTCTTVPVDDRSLTRSPSFKPVDSSSYFAATGSRSTSHTATASRGSTRANAGWLVASTCSSCGVVGIYDDGVLLGKVNLYSATTRHKQVFALPFGGKARSGTITVKVLSPSGRVVLVDGLALRSY